MKLLIIEDEGALITALRRGLRTLYIIDGASTGHDGLHRAEVAEYDAIMLDLSLPDLDGLEVCKRLRKLPNQVPILVLTAQDSVDTKVQLLDAGADDYLIKPFSLEELKARLRVLTRRETPAISSELVVGELILNTATREVTRLGAPINLRRKEFDLLEYLMRNPGKALSRSMIIDHVWDIGDNLWTNAVDVHIKYLRDKIDRPFSTPMIVTVHGVGYKLEATQSVTV